MVGSSTTSGGSASGCARIAERVRDRGNLDAGERDDVARAGGIDFHAVQAVETEHLRDLLGPRMPRAVDDRDRLAALDDAALDAADADRADVARVIELRHLQLQRTVRIDVRRRAVLDDRLEQHLHVAATVGGIVRRETLDGRRVDDREIELRFGRAEAVEQVERLVQHPVWAGLVPVDLVDDHDRTQAVRERLLRDEPRLRHRAVDGIDQQQHGVDHRQHALHLAAEVCMSRGVDDIDPVLVPLDGRVLGQDGDAALLFERIRVHDAFGDDRAGVERAGLLQKLVDKGGLAVVDMRDDRDVAKVLRGVRGHLVRQGPGGALKRARSIADLVPACCTAGNTVFTLPHLREGLTPGSGSWRARSPAHPARPSPTS